jgi:ArsR family transcriptional regulator, arsenate/arsenite/antimonite-responsive transcriptional repressor
MSRRIYSASELQLERLFRALADRTRLRLLNLMQGQEVCVCYFVEVLASSQPKISRHLAYLRRAGIVAARRQGTWMHYRIAPPRDPRAARILKEVLGSLHEDREMQRDRTRLTAACCAPNKFVSLQSAPVPAPFSEPAREGADARG